jgi:hypothetical protein
MKCFHICLPLVLAIATIGPVCAQSNGAASVIGYPSVSAARIDLEGRSNVGRTVQKGWIAFSDPATRTIWLFVPMGAPSYPTVVKRSIVQQGNDAAVIQTNMLCEASKSACDDLAAELGNPDTSVR